MLTFTKKSPAAGQLLAHFIKTLIQYKTINGRRCQTLKDMWKFTRKIGFSIPVAFDKMFYLLLFCRKRKCLLEWVVVVCLNGWFFWGANVHVPSTRDLPSSRFILFLFDGNLGLCNYQIARCWMFKEIIWKFTRKIQNHRWFHSNTTKT